MLEHVWLIPLMPLLAAAACGLAGRSLGERAGTLATGGMFTTLVLSLRFVLNDVRAMAAYPDLYGALPYRMTLFTWMEFGPHVINAGFQVDQVSAIMLLIVSLVGTLVFYYATGYMKGDPGYPRFFAYLSLFAFSMYILVLADNFLMLFVGWEGVGLCSYLLIGFWYKNPEYASAGKKAFLVNRIGDFGFLIAMFILLRWFGTLDFQALKMILTPEVVQTAGVGLFTVITLCLLLAATGKSAQIPLYVWLPDAMAGPTPVSALIHAATMVTAGSVHRRANSISSTPSVPVDAGHDHGRRRCDLALIAALIALRADATSRRCWRTPRSPRSGYMILGASARSVRRRRHVPRRDTHAFFKAMRSFVRSGSVIHACHHEQDMRRMGGLKRKMPITAATYFISALAIAGIPPLSGFFSKDEILWNVIGQAAHGHGYDQASRGAWMALGWPIFHGALWTTGWITAGLTAFYMGRSYYLTFEGETRLSPEKMKKVHESPPSMTRPLIALAFGAAVMGVLGLPGWLAPGEFRLIFQEYIRPALAPEAIGYLLGLEHGHVPFEPSHSHVAEIAFALLSAGIGLGGWLTARGLYLKRGAEGDAPLARIQPLYGRASAKFGVDEMYGRLVTANLFQLARDASERDRTWIDGSIEKVVALTRIAADALRRLQNGQIQTYALSIVIGVNVLLFIYLAV
jgi:NADH-quinone oxidoreductase subunit L